MGAIITKPFAMLMLWFYNLTGDYGWAVILFALAVNVILAPFMAKSKKSMMRQSRLQPRLMELQKHYGQDPQNQQKYQAEMQKLYREEGINPMSGCLWSLIPFPILIALYSVIRQPMTRMLYLSKEAAEALQTYAGSAMGWVTLAERDAYAEIKVMDALYQHMDTVKAAIANGTDGLANVDLSAFQFLNYKFLGVNLGSVPWDGMKTFLAGAMSWAVIGLILIPFISASLSWLSMKVSNLANPQANDGTNPQAQASMKSMQIMMPLMSVYICFIMPSALGIYWIANSVFGMARDYVFTKHFQKVFAKEDAEKLANRSAREKELEEKRLETERLHAEGKSEQNLNTSKKKLQANEKQKNDERKAAQERANRAARREMLGIAETEKPASQVGNRRYARGRAYVEDRFTNPEQAVEKTELAAAASENAAPIDESVETEAVKVDVTGENV